jgi:hypothetical protein
MTVIIAEIKLCIHAQDGSLILLTMVVCPDRLWGPTSLLYNAYRGLFPREYIGRGVKLTTHRYLVRRLTVVELYLTSSTSFHGVVFN